MASSTLRCLPCIDSDQQSERIQRELHLSWTEAESLGRSAVEAARSGFYDDSSGRKVDWSAAVQHARESKVSICPDDALPTIPKKPFEETVVQVRNETTLVAARRMVDDGLRPLALNFANGVQPGGAFLTGAQAQEETLCRSSALFETLVGDPMYDHHREHAPEESTDWSILSPDVPIFRSDNGEPLDQPWLCSFLTCAAPYAPAVGQPRSSELLRQRINRVLAIAHAYGFESLVLGAWGCGAFENDVEETAIDFRRALETNYAGSFHKVDFAIVDWSRERRILAPFQQAFR